MQDLICELQLSPCSLVMPKLYAVTGDRHSGKTSAILSLYHRCQELGVKAFGLCEVAVFAPNGERLGYDFWELPLEQGALGARFVVARKCEVDNSAAGAARMGYTFYDDAFIQARACFSDIPSSGIALIDEMGLLEINGKGLWPLFEMLCVHQALKAIVAVVRRDILKDLEEKQKAFDGICEI